MCIVEESIPVSLEQCDAIVWHTKRQMSFFVVHLQRYETRQDVECWGISLFQKRTESWRDQTALAFRQMGFVFEFTNNIHNDGEIDWLNLRSRFNTCSTWLFRWQTEHFGVQNMNIWHPWISFHFIFLAKTSWGRDCESRCWIDCPPLNRPTLELYLKNNLRQWMQIVLLPGFIVH